MHPLLIRFGLINQPIKIYANNVLLLIELLHPDFDVNSARITNLAKAPETRVLNKNIASKTIPIPQGQTFFIFVSNSYPELVTICFDIKTANLTPIIFQIVLINPSGPEKNSKFRI